MDWIPGTVVGVIALALTILSLHATSRRDRRDLTLKVHQLLIAKDSRMAREQLSVLSGTPDWWVGAPVEQRLEATSVLATFELVAMQIKAGHVDRESILDLWAAPIARAMEQGRGYIEARRRNDDRPDLWLSFEIFAAEAADYQARRATLLHATAAASGLRPN